MAKPTDPSELDVTRRLEVLQYWAGDADSQTRFASRHGLTVKQWNNFLRGYPLGKEAAIQLVRRIPGLTLDWLYLGKVDGLPTRLRVELEEAAERVMISARAGTARK